MPSKKSNVPYCVLEIDKVGKIMRLTEKGIAALTLNC